MKDSTMRHALLRFALFVILTSLLALGSLWFDRPSYRPASEWGGRVALGASDYRRTTEWGWPLGFVIDHPYKAGVDKIDSEDRFDKGALIFDWLVLFMGVSFVYAVGSGAVAMARTVGAPRTGGE